MFLPFVIFSDYICQISVHIQSEFEWINSEFNE